VSLTYVEPPGTPKEDLDTPALLLDLDAVEDNIEKMAAFFRGGTVRLRPHVKTHKTVVFAHKQIAAGAIGMTCAKVGEAEVLVAGGIRDVLIANQVVGRRKLERLTGLVRHADVKVAVDDRRNVVELGRVAREAGVTIGVLLEVDVGMLRCGVVPGAPAVALARQVAETPGVRFRGVMGYEGHIVMLPDLEKRRLEARKSMQLLTETADAIRAAGIPVEIVSGGGTGTFDVSGTYPGITEIQAGSYISMDGRYREVGAPFRCALTVLATVISRPRREYLVVDAGMKAITHEFGLPLVVGVPGATVVKLAEEHGKIELANPAEVALEPGDKLELLPTHGDTTINLHERYYALRAGRLEVVWEIPARGKTR
jgi:D-serine deaminase-like pyridoxal phosphate-dependent protein